MESLPGLFFLLGPEGNFLRWNRKVEAVTGYSSHRLAESNLFDFIPDEETPCVERSLSEVLATRGAGTQLEARFVGAGCTTPHLFSLRRIDFGDRPCLVGTGCDISRRKSAELSRDRLFRLSPDMFCIAGFDGYFKELNPAWERTLGWSLEELRSRPFLDFVHPEDRAITWKEAHDVVEGHPASGLQNRYRCRDGSWKLLDWSCVLVPEHRVIYAVARDITEEREVSRALEESEERFRAFLHRNPAVVWMKDSEGRYVYANEALGRAFGMPPVQVVGKTDEDILPPGVACELKKNDRAILDSSRPMDLVETVPVSDGTVRHWDVWKFPFRNQAGNDFVGGFGTDVTDRFLSEEKVRHSEERYRSLVEGVRDSIFSLSPDGTVTSLNPAFEKITGWSCEEWIGESFPGLVDPADLELATGYFQQTLRGENPTTFELRVRSKVGPSVPMELTSTPQIRDGEVVGVLGIARDIRERVQLEEEVRQMQKLETIGKLAAGISHDYNNILSVQQGCLSLLLMEDKLPDSVKDLLQPIADATDRAAALTRQLLLFSRKQVMEFQNLDLNRIVNDLTKMLGRVLGEDVELRVDCDGESQPIQADPGMIEQVIMNLSVNARDAMPEGGSLAISTRPVHFEEPPTGHPQARKGGFSCLTVTDDGVGMPPEVRSRIFDPFYTTKEVGKGTGLGLSNVHGIVSQHQGWIEVDSEPGEGTTFRIYFPAAATEKSGNLEPVPEEGELGGSETILVVEDEKPLRLMLQNALERYGYRVITATDGPDALRAWEGHDDDVDLLLTDLVMPGGMTGMEVADRIRSRKPGMKIILMSGYSADLAGKHLSSRDGFAFLQKPFPLQKLVLTLRNSLDSESEAKAPDPKGFAGVLR